MIYVRLQSESIRPDPLEYLLEPIPVMFGTVLAGEDDLKPKRRAQSAEGLYKTERNL